MAYTYEDADDVEPISDGVGEQYGNVGIYNVISGCAVTYSAANLTFDVAAGEITHNGLYITVAAQAASGPLVADTTFPRWTWITLSSSGVVGMSAGDPAAIPSVPEYGNTVPIALVYVQANLTVANSATTKLAKTLPTPADQNFTTTLKAFRANRRVVAEYSAQNNATAGTVSPVGVGFQQLPVNSSDIVSNISGEPIMRFSVGAAGSGGVLSGTAAGGELAVLSANKSPRLYVRVQFPAASANVSIWKAGFFSNNGATALGAYLSITTTGNVLFVTRNSDGGTTSTTDLGGLSRTTILGYEIESPDAGVTWYCRNEAGTIVATSTTNLPTVTTALAYGVQGITATGAVPWGVAMARVEATTA